MINIWRCYHFYTWVYINIGMNAETHTSSKWIILFTFIPLLPPLHKCLFLSMQLLGGVEWGENWSFRIFRRSLTPHKIKFQMGFQSHFPIQPQAPAATWNQCPREKNSNIEPSTCFLLTCSVLLFVITLPQVISLRCFPCYSQLKKLLLHCFSTKEYTL